ncbi:hypothetical protein JIN85_11405 [Luteolibacter pohnpeiensis]|uniref:Beta-xylosidase C-terminal Concanavalin A-like domain-containing protein n=1 Tax=Luteolibacter pohnpeiensis TaxID=454153 RepID=A0A934VW85_9BACT|nr:hypothetical protein [Luteolibacter pohnpeiensis]MBK1883025.1 hypothetical protein [Luteolibacter pohnpeiensis]
MTLRSILALGFLSSITLVAQESTSKRQVFPALVEPTAKVEGWGTSVNPELDCQFELKDGKLTISVPPTQISRDLAAEIGVVNAPRVLQPVKGDFSFTVRVEGNSKPDGGSTQQGRVSYTGAALILMADTDHVVTLARAAISSGGGKPNGYANFEIRSAGKLLQMGSGENPLPVEGPVFMKLERHGNEVRAAISVDGAMWKDLPAKKLPESWPEQSFVGVAAITTSASGFEPTFTQIRSGKSSNP